MFFLSFIFVILSGLAPSMAPVVFNVGEIRPRCLIHPGLWNRIRPDSGALVGSESNFFERLEQLASKFLSNRAFIAIFIDQSYKKVLISQ